MATRIDRRYVPDMIRLVRRLSVKAKTGEPFIEADAEEVIVKLNLVTGLKPDDQTYAPLADAFRAKLLAPRPNDAVPPSAPPS